MIILDIYEVAKLFVARGATLASHHKQNYLWKCLFECYQNELFTLLHSAVIFFCSVVDKSGKLLAGPLPTAEQNISEFLRYFVKIF